MGVVIGDHLTVLRCFFQDSITSDEKRQSSRFGRLPFLQSEDRGSDGKNGKIRVITEKSVIFSISLFSIDLKWCIMKALFIRLPEWPVKGSRFPVRSRLPH
jgi:hypothetical protein